MKPLRHTSTTQFEVLAARVGVIGDVHAEDALLRNALDHFSTSSIESILCTGDVVDGLGSAQKCCDLLQEYGVLAVRGNHDRWFAEGTFRDLADATPTEALGKGAQTFLAELPSVRTFSTLLGSLLLCHGLGTNDMAKVDDDDFGYALETNDDLQALLRVGQYRFVVNGHSHCAMVRAFGPLTIINAGTLMRANDPRVLVVDFAQSHVEVFGFDNGRLARTPSATLAIKP